MVFANAFFDNFQSLRFASLLQKFPQTKRNLSLQHFMSVFCNPDKVIFDAVDAAGNPIKFSFYNEGDTYTLKVEETTWDYFEAGDEFSGMKKSAN